MKEKLSRKEKILISAIEIINDLGVQGFTIKELAKRENVTQGAIYRHFKSKQQIFLEMFSLFTRHDEEIFNTAIYSNYSLEEGLKYILLSFFNYYGEYPQITSLLFTYGSFHNEPQVELLITDIEKTRFDRLINYLKRFTDSNKLHTNENIEFFANILYGTARELIFSWRISNYSFSLKESVATMSDFFFKALCLL